jgi:hypothetical protein
VDPAFFLGWGPVFVACEKKHSDVQLSTGRRQLEHKSGKKVVSGRNYLPNKPTRSLPGQDENQ